MLQRMTLLLFLGLSACTSDLTPSRIDFLEGQRKLYSLTGQERRVQFKALYRSTAKVREELNSRELIYKIQDTTQFLFGPLTYRDLGGVQKGEKINLHLDEAFVENQRVMIPYTYEATWMIHRSVGGQNSLRLPLPYSVPDLKTAQWQNCTDPGEDHNTWSFFWYFWEPQRQGCDHRLNVHYQEIEVLLQDETPQTKTSYPEYVRMIRHKNGVPTLSMTFAFGYVEDLSKPNPFKDSDFGMRQFQRFYRDTKDQLLAQGFAERPILQQEITQGTTAIGAQFTGYKQGVRLEISVVAAAGVDQMDLFAHSYARNHEAFFGWFGHSRVGSGFDARIFEYKLHSDPQRFSLTKDYQLVYWAGCNSYSYYTLPFFALKSELDPESDPQGTRNLDLISNTLPSLFAFNAANAQVLREALIHWDQPTSYQSILQDIENTAASWEKDVIVNVLGDEDNSR